MMSGRCSHLGYVRPFMILLHVFYAGLEYSIFKIQERQAVLPRWDIKISLPIVSRGHFRDETRTIFVGPA